MDEIVMGNSTPNELASWLSKAAMLILPLGKAAGLAYGPVMPGPEIKNPKTSLNTEFSKPKYSCDPKTYLNETESLLGTKSNSKTAISFTLLTLKFWPIKAGTLFATSNKSGSSTGGLTSTKSPKPSKVGSKIAISPVLITIPLFNPRLEEKPLKYPNWMESPWKEKLEASTPEPNNISFTRYSGLS